MNRLEKWASLVAGPKTKWITLFVWIVIVGLVNGFWPQVNKEVKNNEGLFTRDYPSVVASKIEKREYPSESGKPGLLVWFRASGLTSDDVKGIVSLTKSLGEKPLDHQSNLMRLDQIPPMVLPSIIAPDAKAFILPISFDDKAEVGDLKKSRAALIERVDTIFADKPFDVKTDDASKLLARFTGPVGIAIDATDLFLSADLKLIIATTMLVLVLLLLIYRSPILAFLPLIGVGFAYGVISPMLGWMAQNGWIIVEDQSTSIMSVLLFGAGTDYCLFLIARFREILQVESSKTKALLQAFSGTVGAITMSGLTVVISLLTLLLADQGNIQRFAIPFSLAILIMMVASVTLMPALLAIFGRASFFPFIPRTESMLRERATKKNKPYVAPKQGGRIGNWIGRTVVTRPWTIIIATVVILGGMGVMVTQIEYTNDILSSFPKNMPSREGFNIIGNNFSKGDLAPLTVIADLKGKDIDVGGTLKKLDFLDRIEGPTAGKETTSLQAWTVRFKGNPYDSAVVAHIPDVRSAVETALSDAGLTDSSSLVWIAGQSATQYDQEQANSHDTNLIVPMVIGLISLLLLVYLRSIVATVYLVLTVILSFFSALGVGWLVLHYGMGAEAISGAIPLYSFVFIVALGEDYNIFMISGIWKKRLVMPLKQAISEGVSDTSGVITSAGLILAGTFAVLATLPIQVLLQFGIITAIGVLLDTFIVRPFLVPAITVVLGKSAFWPGDHRVVMKEMLK